MKSGLRSKLEGKTARIGIMGLGYVGLPLAVEFADKGFFVTGFEVNPAVVRALTRGVSHVEDVDSGVVRELVKSKRLRVTGSFDSLRDMDAVIICVPTPLRKSKEPDVTYIMAASREIASRLRRDQLIVLESTTYPGTTRELVQPLFEKTGLKAGKDFHLAFSPERVDPGNKNYRIPNTPKVVGGITRTCTEMATLLYSHAISKVVPVSNADAAEMVKLLENTFRAVNIGLVNEVALMCHRLGLDVWEIIGAAASKPFGFMPFYPGPGIGGHCIPLDPHYLAWKMKSLNFEPRFIELAGVINGTMPEYAVRRMAAVLNADRKAMNGSRALVIGTAYKPNVGDVRESPALDLIKLLKDEGALVRYHDPYVGSVSVEGTVMHSVALTAKTLRDADITVIATAHACVDYDLVLRASRRIFDARNALKGCRNSKVHRL